MDNPIKAEEQLRIKKKQTTELSISGKYLL